MNKSKTPRSESPGRNPGDSDFELLEAFHERLSLAFRLKCGSTIKLIPKLVSLSIIALEVLFRPWAAFVEIRIILSSRPVERTEFEMDGLLKIARRSAAITFWYAPSYFYGCPLLGS